MIKKHILKLSILLIVLLNSCNEYQKILKSCDLDFKFDKAVELFQNEEYVKAFPLFDELLLLYRGTDKAEQIYYYYSISEYKKGNLLSAAYHLNNFANTYRTNIKAEECAYLSVYCYYLLSPKYSLDQINTYKALDEASIFLDTYPLSTYYNDCLDLQTKLKLKLDRKSFESAKLYYTTQNYKSAIHAFNFTLQENPNSSFIEEILFLQLKSYYFLAKNSVEEKKDKRIKDTIIAFNQFKNTYPNSQYLNESKLIHKQVKLLRE